MRECGPNVCIVSISRRARASSLEPFSRPGRLDPGFARPRAIRSSARSRYPCRDRIGAVSAQRHPREVPDELDRPPPKRRPASADPACSRGARPADDPGPFDRRLQLTIRFSKNDCPSSRHTPHRISPRGAGALGTRRAARFGGPVRACGACSSPSPRTGVPLTPRRFAGVPGRALMRPPASARGSPFDDPRVVPESLGLLHQSA
jgi:hypothetical protein